MRTYSLDRCLGYTIGITIQSKNNIDVHMKIGMLCNTDRWLAHPLPRHQQKSSYATAKAEVCRLAKNIASFVTWYNYL